MARGKEFYPAAYGTCGGQVDGIPPSYRRCCVPVWDREKKKQRQCSRYRGYGPGAAYCDQHAKLVKKGEGL